MASCECGLLHAEPSRSGGCQDCGTACCPSCAIEVDTRTYCRWCAISLQPALTA